MRVSHWLFIAAAGLSLAACQRQAADPLTEARQTCFADDAEAEAKMEACGALIDSGELEVAERGDAFANRGAANYEAGDVTSALRDYNAALEIAPENMLAVKGRALVLVESGQLDAAEPLVQRLIQSNQFTAEAHYLAGNIARARSDYAAATEAYTQSIAADRNFAPSYAGRGAIKQSQGDYPAALADFDAAIRINPQLTPALAGRCWTRVQMEDNNMDQARRDADAAAEGDPRNVQAQLCRGLLQLRAGEWANARSSYEAALEVEPGNPSALFGRGVARRRSGDDDGRADMNQARDFDSHVARTFEDLGVQTY